MTIVRSAYLGSLAGETLSFGQSWPSAIVVRLRTNCKVRVMRLSIKPPGKSPWIVQESKNKGRVDFFCCDLIGLSVSKMLGEIASRLFQYPLSASSHTIETEERSIEGRISWGEQSVLQGFRWRSETVRTIKKRWVAS